MFLTKKEIRRRRLQKAAEMAGIAVAAFAAEIILGMLLCM